MDAANVDLKAFTESFYAKTCAGHLRPVLDTLEYAVHETDVWVEVTTLLIPGLNDSNGELDALTRWVAERLGVDVPLHFSAFHPDWKLRDQPPTPAATLTRAREIAVANGLRYVYTGNVHDPAGQSTYCHACGSLLVERDWYELGAWNLVDESCARCGEPCAGVFENRPGAWGSRRLPVRLAA
jgi:pyruvate formate lyase activating enzyme